MIKTNYVKRKVGTLQMMFGLICEKLKHPPSTRDLEEVLEKSGAFLYYGKVYKVNS